MFELNKDLVVNSAADYAVTILDDNGATVAPSNLALEVLTADHKLLISGFGNFRAGDIVAVAGQRGVAGQVRVDNIVISNVDGSSQLDVAAPSIPTVVYFKYKVTTTRYRAEYAQNQMQFSDTIIYPVVVRPGDTNQDVAAKLLAVATDRQTRFPDDTGIEITLTGGTASAPTQLTVTGKAGDINWEVSVEDEFDVESSIITEYSSSVATKRVEGIQDARFLRESVRLLTYASTRPYGELQDQLAISGALYHSVTFEIENARPDLRGNSVAGQVNKSGARLSLYANSNLAGGTTSYFGQIATFLDKAATLNGLTAVLIDDVITDGNKVGEGEVNTTAALADFIA